MPTFSGSIKIVRPLSKVFHLLRVQVFSRIFHLLFLNIKKHGPNYCAF